MRIKLGPISDPNAPILQTLNGKSLLLGLLLGQTYVWTEFKTIAPYTKVACAIESRKTILNHLKNKNFPQEHLKWFDGNPESQINKVFI